MTARAGSHAGNGLGKPQAAARSPASTAQPVPQLGVPSPSASPRIGRVSGSTGGEPMNTFSRPDGVVAEELEDDAAARC